MNDIPRIDLSQDESFVVKELMEAFTTIGFATLTHHGIEASKIQAAFQASRTFFGLPIQTKRKYKFQGHASNRGYIGTGSETHDLEEDCAPDAKETMDLGKEGEPGFSNYWPEELKETSYRKDLLEYYTSMDQLYLKLMRFLGMGLQLPDPEVLVKQCNEQHENLRMLHYNALPTPTVRGNIHTDFGTLTLLVQDNVGGLKVKRRDGTWMFVEPVKNAIIVNVGDMLMRWSNDLFKATLHQVVSPPTSKAKDGIPERYSIAFFCNANKNTMLECLEPCCREEKAKYAPVNAHEYLTKRLADTIAADDAP